MKVLIIGGTGLLGREGGKELLARNHQLRILSRNSISKEDTIFAPVESIIQDYTVMTTQQMEVICEGCEGFVFAAGVDEREEAGPVAYDYFYKKNIVFLEKFFPIAKRKGIRHYVILGSYFSYFDRTKPEWQLTKYHPYIRSRVDQANLALSFADQDTHVAVLEIPYVFGSKKGKEPVWTFLVKMIQSMKLATFYPPGGTAVVTKKQVGQYIAGALLANRGANNYPVAYYEMTWKTMLGLFHLEMKRKQKIITVPEWVFFISCVFIDLQRKRRGIEGGLLMRKFSKVMASKTYFLEDQEEIWKQFGVKEDDIEKAVRESVRESLVFINKEKK